MRAHFGLAPGRRAQPPAQDDLGYVGQEFRVYEYMQIGFAIRFYATLHERWDAEVLARALKTASLEERFDVRRMKRAYKRALVLAFALAASPRVLVVEGAEEFDEPGARALLQSAVATVPSVVVTYAPEAAIDRAWYDDILVAPDVTFETLGSGESVATFAASGSVGALGSSRSSEMPGSPGGLESSGAFESSGSLESSGSPGPLVTP